jgi:hypothetical protein
MQLVVQSFRRTAAPDIPYRTVWQSYYWTNVFLLPPCLPSSHFLSDVGEELSVREARISSHTLPHHVDHTQN